MLLVCPECDAKYQIADGAIPEKGRNVRCAACGHYWFQKRDGISKDSLSFSSEKLETNFGKAKEPIKTKALPKLPHEIMREKSHNKIIFTQIAGIAAGYLIAIGIGAGAIFGFLANKESISEKWPKSASLYRFLGSPINQYGLEIKNIQVRAGVDSQGSRLVIAGVVRSIDDKTRNVPYLRVNLSDKKGKIVASWLIDPKVTMLEAHKSTSFESIRRNPPSGDLVARVFFEGPPNNKINIVKTHAPPINNHAANIQNAPQAVAAEDLSHGSEHGENHNANISADNSANHIAANDHAATGHEKTTHEATNHKSDHSIVGR